MAIGTAITNLNTAIAKDLSNLTNTGTALNTTIDGFTATLGTEVDSAATGLANATNQSVLALNKEVNTDLQSATNQAISAIQNDTPTGTISAATLKTYNQAVQTAYQAFSLAISNAEQTSISGGTALSSSAVTAAVSSLQTALDTAIAGLGLTSKLDPTTTVNSTLTTLTTTLTGLTVPTAGNKTSSNLFVRTVSSAISQAEGQINQTVSTAIQNYNNSLF